MNIDKIDSTQYSQLFDKSYIPYNTVAFNMLNSYKCDRLEFLLFHEYSVKLGLIAGIKDSGLSSPFSAPFSSFSFLDNNIRNSYILAAIKALEEYAIKNQLISLRFTLPPYFYNEHIISKLIYSFFKSSYSVIVDDNHFFCTKDFLNYENGTIKKGVKYNLKVANKLGLFFKKSSSIYDYRIAFDIIKKNKESKDRPLLMTFEQLREMKDLVDIDYFLVYYKDQPIASSIVYIYSPRIVQIIYWGDLPSFNCCYAMNYLAMNIFRFYSEGGFEVIDLGNSSKNSEPNFGLSNFKEIIGCTATIKFTFIKTL
jgi:hypothetical protein